MVNNKPRTLDPFEHALRNALLATIPIHYENSIDELSSVVNDVAEELEQRGIEGDERSTAMATKLLEALAKHEKEMA